jgi:hypothetical protein
MVLEWQQLSRSLSPACAASLDVLLEHHPVQLFSRGSSTFDCSAIVHACVCACTHARCVVKTMENDRESPDLGVRAREREREREMHTTERERECVCVRA